MLALDTVHGSFSAARRCPSSWPVRWSASAGATAAANARGRAGRRASGSVAFGRDGGRGGDGGEFHVARGKFAEKAEAADDVGRGLRRWGVGAGGEARAEGEPAPRGDNRRMTPPPDIALGEELRFMLNLGVAVLAALGMAGCREAPAVAAPASKPLESSAVRNVSSER